MRLDHLIARTYLTRALRLWFAARLLLGVVFAFAGIDPWQLPFRLSTVFVLVAAGLCVLEVRIQHERILLANLGLPLSLIAALSMLPAMIGEGIVRIVIAWAR